MLTAYMTTYSSFPSLSGMHGGPHIFVISTESMEPLIA
jgi:hypothetical protein